MIYYMESLRQMRMSHENSEVNLRQKLEKEKDCHYLILDLTHQTQKLVTTQCAIQEETLTCTACIVRKKNSVNLL